MQKLKCKEEGCRNNYCKHCVKDVIQISKEAYCRSFDDKNDQNANHAKFEFEFACDVGLNTEQDMHHILCNENNCNYWNCGECNSHSVKVDKRPAGARCITYIPKGK